MKILLILGHPNPKSFNHGIAERVKKTLEAHDHIVTYHDLYREGFDPLLPEEELPKDAELGDLIKEHCRDIAETEGIIIVHPNWWGQPPAILKGWIDRVIRPGVAYQFNEGDNGEGVPKGLLKAKSALVLNTSDTGEERERSVFGDPLQNIWEKCIFDFCGIKNFHRKTFGIMVTSSMEQRKAWLDETEKIVKRIFSD